MTTTKPQNTMNKNEMKALGDEFMEYIADKTGEKVIPKNSHPTVPRKSYSMIEFSQSEWNLWFMVWGKKGSGGDFYLVLFDGERKNRKDVLHVDMRRVQFNGKKYKWVLGPHRTFATVISEKYEKVEKNETCPYTGSLLYDGADKNKMMEAFVDLLGTIMESSYSKKMESSDSKKTYEMGSREAIEGYVFDSNPIVFSRDPGLPKKCKKRDDYTCQACDTKIFINGKYIIEAHHINPLRNGIRTTTLDDLVSLCPNCHRIAHLRKHPYSADEIRKLRNA